MRSRQLETALTEFLGEAAVYLHGEVAAGAEVAFELGARVGRRAQRSTPLYCYHALTGEFIAEREPALARLPGYAEAVKLLDGFDGLDRYLVSVAGEAPRTKGRARARVAMRALLEDVFDEQTDFELNVERLRAALERLERSALAGASRLTLVATLHGLTITSPELPLTTGLTIAHQDALEGVPDAAITTPGDGRSPSHLIVVYTAEDDAVEEGLTHGRELLLDLLRALRLFGDGRITLGALAWARVGAGGWGTLALGTGGRPRGMLVVAAEQEDELRAFCSLVSRRAPRDNELAWALRRFELGCERENAREALTDDLLALRALLEPEGASSGLLAGRLAALCATPAQRAQLTERIARAVAVERSVIAGSRTKRGEVQTLEEDLATHLRALLRDVICGHLTPDLASLADELLRAPEVGEPPEGEPSEDEVESELEHESAGAELVAAEAGATDS